MNSYLYKLVILLIGFLSASLLPLLNANNTFVIAPNERKVLSHVAKILTASQSSQQKLVWPTYNLAQSPVVITFKSGHVFVFNLHSENPLWQKISLEGINILYSSKDHWGLTRSAFQPQFPLEGQQAYVFNLDKATNQPPANDSYQTLVHERFHRYQFENFLVNSTSGPYQDHLNIENLTLAKVEENILADFMRERGNSYLQMEHLRNFIAINILRRAWLEQNSVEWEDHQQIMEGLADYVSFKTMDSLAFFGDMAGHQNLQKLLEKECKNTDYSDHAIKWRHYSIGATLGYILDFLRLPDWKKHIEQGEATLSEIIIDQLALSPEEIQSRIEQCKIIYRWEEKFALVAKSVHKFEDEMNGCITAYKALSGVVLEVGHPLLGMSGSGSNARLIYLADGSTLSLKDNLSSSTEDNLWNLSLQEMPYVFKKGNGFIEFKVEPETQVILDNETYTLKEILKLQGSKPFKYLELKGKNSHFTSEKHEGYLTIVENRRLSISYTN